MALVLKDRVQETATANTTVSFSLAGAVTGFQTFSSAIGNTNTTYYSATDASGNWEIGIGTYATTGNLLTRTTISTSSNANAAVTFSGTVTVFVTYPAGKALYTDASGNAVGLGTVAATTTLTNATGLPISTGVSGLGANIATALGTAVGSAGSVVVNGGVLGTPSSGTVTNLTGTASININGTVGATTRATGAFTTLGANGAVTVQTTTNNQSYTTTGAGTITMSSGTAGSIDNMNVGATTSSTGKFTTLEMTSVTDASSLARNVGQTANTSITNQTTFTTGGLTLLSQVPAAGSNWRIKAFGQFDARNNATVRTAQVACFWGTTQLVAITPSVLVSTAQTTQWQLEFNLTCSSATAIWTSGTLLSRIASATALAVDNATPASTAISGTQTIDVRFRVTTGVANEGWIIQGLTIERLK